MTLDEANQKLNDVVPDHYQRIDFDPDIVLDGVYTLDHLKKIVEIFESYLVS